MNKILKHYLKSFFKSITSSLATLIYLFFLFLIVFSFSVFSIQKFNYYLPFLIHQRFYSNNINSYYSSYNFDKFDIKANKAAAYFNNLKANYIFKDKDKIDTGKHLVFNTTTWYKIIIAQIYVNHNQQTSTAPWNDYATVITNLEANQSINNQPHNLKLKFKNQFAKLLVQIYVNGHISKNRHDFFNTILVNSSSNKFSEYKLKDLFKHPNSSFYQLLVKVKFNLTLLFLKTTVNNLDNFDFAPQFFFQDFLNFKKNDNSVKNFLFILGSNQFRNHYNKIFTSKSNALAELNKPSNDHQILVNAKFLHKHHYHLNQQIYLFNNPKVLREHNLDIDNWPLLYQKFKIIATATNFTASSRLDSKKILSIIDKKNNTYGNIYLNKTDYFQLCQEVLNNFNTYNLFAGFNFLQPNNPAALFKANFLSQSNTNILTNLSNQQTTKIVDYFLKQKVIKDNYVIQKLFYNLKSTAAYRDYSSALTTIIVNCVFIIFNFGIAFIFITFLIQKDITTSKRMIGIFKAAGYQRHQIAWVYSLKTLLSFGITSVLGYICSIPLQMTLTNFYNTNSTSIFSLSRVIYVWWFLVFIFVFIPLIFTLISFLINIKCLNKSVTWLLYNQVNFKSVKVLKKIKFLFQKVNFYNRVQLSFTIQNFGKWIPILIIFAWANMLLIVITSFSTAVTNNAYNLLLNDMYQDQIQTIYNYNFNTKTKVVNNSGKEQQFQTIYQQNQFALKNYSQLYSSRSKKVQASLDYWKKIANNVDNILAINLKAYPCVSIKTWNQALKTVTNQLHLPKVILNLFTNLAKNNPYENKLIISFNHLFFNPKQEIKVFTTNVESNYFRNFNLNSSSKMPIIGVNSIVDLQKGFKIDNLKLTKQIKAIFLQKTINKITKKDYLTIPIIITKILAKNLNVKLNDDIYYSDLNNDISLLSSNTNNAKRIFHLKLHVIGILPKNIYGKYFLTSYQELARFFLDVNHHSFESYLINDPFGLDNQVLSNLNTFPKIKDIVNIGKNFNKTLFNTYYLPLYNGSVKSYFQPQPLPLLLFLENLKTAHFSPQFPINLNKTVNNVIYVPQIKNEVNEIDADLFLIQRIQLVFVFFMIGLLLVTCMSVIIEENLHIIAVLKANGYKGYQINWLIVGNYFFAVLLAAILSLFFAHFLLMFVNYLIYTLTTFLLPLSINLKYYALILGFSFLTILSCFLITMRIINKKQVTEILI